MSNWIVITLFFSILSAGTAVAAPADSTRKKLHQNTVIQGYPCAKGYQWFYADGN